MKCSSSIFRFLILLEEKNKKQKKNFSMLSTSDNLVYSCVGFVFA